MLRFASILAVIVVGLASGCKRAGPKGGGGADGGRPETRGGEVGDPAATAGHLVGTWEGLGEGGTYLLYTFEANGGFVMLESPGTGTGPPKGDKVRGTYTVRGATVTVQVAGETRVYTVSEVDQLMLVLAPSQGRSTIFHRQK